jgi:hypothetical protein
MKQTVATTFDAAYWSAWGLSWLASLRELAGFTGEVVVFDAGLEGGVAHKLGELGVRVLPLTRRYGVAEMDRHVSLAGLAASEPGVYVGFDADLYFQGGLDELFRSAADRLVATGGGKTEAVVDFSLPGIHHVRPAIPGPVLDLVASALGPETLTGRVVGGDAVSLSAVVNFMAYCVGIGRVAVDRRADQVAMSLFARYFPTRSVALPGWWCRQAGPWLEWRGDGYYAGRERVRVVHTGGADAPTAKYFSFPERYAREYRKWRTKFRGNGVTPGGILRHVGKLPKRPSNDVRLGPGLVPEPGLPGIPAVGDPGGP